MDADLQAMRDAVNAAGLPEDVQQTVTWCLDQLPALYEELGRTYDAKCGDEIRRLVQGILGALTDVNTAGARRVVGAVTLRLVAMHERLGLPTLGLKALRRRQTC